MRRKKGGGKHFLLAKKRTAQGRATAYGVTGRGRGSNRIEEKRKGLDVSPEKASRKKQKAKHCGKNVSPREKRKKREGGGGNAVSGSGGREERISSPVGHAVARS